MEKSHLILNNPISRGDGVRLNRKVNIPDKDNEDDDDKDYDFQVQKIHECQVQFYSDRRRRDDERDKQLQIPHYDYIRIHFFKPYRKSVSSWGLKEISVTDMGLSVLYWIEDEEKFKVFMTRLNDIVENIALIQSGNKNKIITLIESIELYD